MSATGIESALQMGLGRIGATVVDRDTDQGDNWNGGEAERHCDAAADVRGQTTASTEAISYKEGDIHAETFCSLLRLPILSLA